MLPLSLLGVVVQLGLHCLDMVGTFDSYLIVFHDFRLLCVILVNVMTSSHLLFFSSNSLSISLFPDYIVPRQNDCV